jgi:hypothetical protein
LSSTAPAEAFINIQELRDLIYARIALSSPTQLCDYSGLLLSCKTINSEATEALLAARRRVNATAKKYWSKIYGGEVRIPDPVSLSDLNSARVELPQSMFTVGRGWSVHNLPLAVRDRSKAECAARWVQGRRQEDNFPLSWLPLDTLTITTYPKFDTSDAQPLFDAGLMEKYQNNIQGCIEDMEEYTESQSCNKTPLGDRPWPVSADHIVFDYCGMAEVSPCLRTLPLGWKLAWFFGSENTVRMEWTRANADTEVWTDSESDSGEDDADGGDDEGLGDDDDEEDDEGDDEESEEDYYDEYYEEYDDYICVPRKSRGMRM